MGNLLKPKLPTPQEQAPLPQPDDDAVRRAQLKQFAKVGQTSGRESTMIAEKNLGDAVSPQTRSGVLTG